MMNKKMVIVECCAMCPYNIDIWANSIAMCGKAHMRSHINEKTLFPNSCPLPDAPDEPTMQIGGPFEGTIENADVYNRELTADEIAPEDE